MAWHHNGHTSHTSHKGRGKGRHHHHKGIHPHKKSVHPKHVHKLTKHDVHQALLKVATGQ